MDKATPVAVALGNANPNDTATSSVTKPTIGSKHLDSKSGKLTRSKLKEAKESMIIVQECNSLFIELFFLSNMLMTNTLNINFGMGFLKI